MAQDIEAMRAALAAEQIAIYGYGVAGAHLTGSARTAATTAWTAHQAAADRLTALLRARGVIPPAAAVAYQLRHKVSTAAQARALLAALEEQATSAYMRLVALSDESLRMLGAREVRVCALRTASWHSRTVAFPGLPASALVSHSRPATSRGPRGRALSG